MLLAAASAALSASSMGCSSGHKTSADAQVPVMPRTDVEGLERLINLPCRPIEVKWTTAAQPGRDDWSLRVLLRVSADDLQQILKRADDSGERRAHMSPEQLAWMPETVRSETKASDAKAGLIQVDAIPISVDQFAAPSKSPLLQGTALVFEKHNLVYLGLYTM